MIRRTALIALVAAAGVGLSGCISLFPKTDPAQLYRFEAKVPEQPAQKENVSFLRLTTGFARASSGDRILTISNGGEAAYIAETRWVAPASVLFDEQVSSAFQSAGRARLISRGEIVKAAYAIRMDVQRFEAVYDEGDKSAPNVVVSVRTVITRTHDRSLVGDKVFTSTVRAGDNRVRAIVPAFNQALSDTLTEAVTWADGLPPTQE